MAAAAPLVPVVTLAPAPNNPFFDEDPVSLPAGHSLVAATGAFMNWQASPAVPNQIAHVAVPFYKLLFAFGTRFKVSPIPADQVAARAVNRLVVRRLGHRHLVLLLQLVHTICPLLVAHLALGAAQLLRAQLDLERLALLGHLLSQVQ